MFRVIWWNKKGVMRTRDVLSRKTADLLVDQLIKGGFPTAHWIELP